MRAGTYPARTGRAGGLGLFYRDTRFFSRYDLTLDGEALVLLSSHEGGGAWILHVLGHPELETEDGCIAPHPSGATAWSIRARSTRSLPSPTSTPNQVHLALELAFAADFIDIFVVRGIADPPAPALRDSGGYLDYRGDYGNGLVNPGWKDSGVAITNADGSLATPPIALCEVQGYLYRAWLAGANLLELTSDPRRCTMLRVGSAGTASPSSPADSSAARPSGTPCATRWPAVRRPGRRPRCPMHW
ncbi:MAG: glycogen debranching N-terminal domain-containing protein [Steroidobacteraceae bacterium]